MIRRLTNAGWQLVATRGSHRQFKHPEQPGRVTVAGKPGDDLAPGTLKSIARQSGLRLPLDPPIALPAMRPSYAVVIEEAEGNFCAHVPDLPGCVATGGTRDEVLVQIRTAIAFHLEGMATDAALPPTPRTSVATVTL